MKYAMPSAIVRQVREGAGLSQRELAKKARTAQSVVARIELGETDQSWETLSRLVNASGFELSADVRRKPVLDASELNDIARILRLSPEERLREVAQVDRFISAARRV